LIIFKKLLINFYLKHLKYNKMSDSEEESNVSGSEEEEEEESGSGSEEGSDEGSGEESEE
jgi:hypothetical protein